MGDFLKSVGLGSGPTAYPSTANKPVIPPSTSAPPITSATPMTNSLFGQTLDSQTATASNPYGDIPAPDIMSMAAPSPAQPTQQMSPAQDIQSPSTPQGPAPSDNQYDSFNPNIPQDVQQTVGTPDTPPTDAQINNNLDNIDVAGFHPQHIHGLASIADFFLKGMLSRHLDKHNLETAMQSFTENPENTIRKVATFDAPAAWRMQQQYLRDQASNVRDQASAASADKSRAATDVLIDKAVLPQVGGLAMAVAQEKDPVKQQALWEKARQRILAVGEQYNRDYTKVFPEKFDADSISLAIGQAINPAKQETLQQGQTRLNQGQERIGLQGEDIHSKIGRRNAMTAQGAAREAEQEQKTAQQDKNRQDAISRKYGLPTDAKEGYAVMNPGGKQGVKYHNGRWMRFLRGDDGQLHPIGYL